ncbi:unnamed protein product [Adineta ricciae]|uniref:LIM zinc-binding domain-containing protein n=1 Tax=Adineta ricciae TaxID=249248 RepID=A0A813PM08_ADIRI|nr:unnamed protein product [Adineta ricciae]
MNLDRHSPSPATIRLISPRPFYRSQITPDPFDYSNNANNNQPYQLQRQYSANQISGSPVSTSYFSDHEPSSPTFSVHPQYNQQYRSANNNQRSALISVSASQSPLITIASGGSTNRQQIRFSSVPKTTKSTLHEIRISRPDSPTISINRSGTNQPITFTTTPNGSTITNGTSGAFHISLGTPSSPTQRETFHQIRDASSRFTPVMVYTTPTTNAFDRSSAVVNLPPPSLSIRNGHFIRREQPDIDHLAKLLMRTIHTATEGNVIGTCGRCNDEIIGEENGLVAMDRMYHVPCFTCTMCGCRLRGMHFYSMENQPYCESCYIHSLEKCVVCALPITDRILRATGKPYHAQCFCCVACNKSLDGVAFTVDAAMQIHCIDCFHQKFAPRCYVCHQPILPASNEEETVRIVALDRSYHVDCYRCENCKTQFDSEQGCYPIDDHLFCSQCNRIYTKSIHVSS